MTEFDLAAEVFSETAQYRARLNNALDHYRADHEFDQAWMKWQREQSARIQELTNRLSRAGKDLL